MINTRLAVASVMCSVGLVGCRPTNPKVIPCEAGACPVAEPRRDAVEVRVPTEFDGSYQGKLGEGNLYCRLTGLGAGCWRAEFVSKDVPGLPEEFVCDLFGTSEQMTGTVDKYVGRFKINAKAAVHHSCGKFHTLEGSVCDSKRCISFKLKR